MARRDGLRADLRAFVERDPATGSALEVLLTAPGLYALWSYRLARWLWLRDRRLLARTIATLSRLVTGIEIHPGADLGERVVIDHGQGTVIGSTAVVGDDVLLYHGVTLGAREERTGKRHPTVGDDVTLGANATVLGDVEIGDGATVGAGAVVVDPVPPGETVVGVPARPVESSEAAAGGAEADATDAAGADTDADAAEIDATDAAGADADGASEDAVADAADAPAPAETRTAVESDQRAEAIDDPDDVADDGDAGPDDEPAYPECVCEPPWP